MNRKQIEDFKEQMESYRYLTNKVKMLKEDIENQWYDMTHVKAVSYGDIKVQVSEAIAHSSKLKEIEKVNWMIEELEQKEKRLKSLNRILDLMKPTEREMYILKYYEGKSYQEIANLFYISKTGLYYRMDQALVKVEL